MFLIDENTVITCWNDSGLSRVTNEAPDCAGTQPYPYIIANTIGDGDGSFYGVGTGNGISNFEEEI